MSSLIAMESEYMTELMNDLPKELSTIPKPWFVTNIFPESLITICRPLDPPFDHLAITHLGEIFMYRPLRIVHLNFKDDLESFAVIDPACVLHQGFNREGRTIAILQDKRGYRDRVLVDRLMMDRFYNLPMTDPHIVYHVDDVLSNNHIRNLEAILPGDRHYPEEYEQGDWHEHCPVH